MDEINIFSTFEENKNFITGLQNKFPKLSTNNLSLFPENLNLLISKKKDKKKIIQ